MEQALIWSKMSTGLPIEITSSMKGQNYVSYCRLDIDIHKYVLIGGLIVCNDSFSHSMVIMHFKYILHSCYTGTFLMFMHMRKGKTRTGGMEQKFKLS